MRSRVLAIIGVAALGLAACGGSSSTTRNAEGDMLSCVSQADSKITVDGQLELHFCKEATEWIRQNPFGEPESEKMPIVDGVAKTTLDGFWGMKVHTFDANGNRLGIDKIVLNGSRGGFTYSVDTRKSSPVFYEVATREWSGSDSDPRIGWSQGQELVTKFNNSFAPVGDWFIPSESEAIDLLNNKHSSEVAQLVHDHDTSYWTTQKSIFSTSPYYLAIRPVNAEGGLIGWFRADSEDTIEYVRPVRSFTPGDGPVILVHAGLAATLSNPTTPTIAVPSEEPSTSSPEVSTSPTINDTSQEPDVINVPNEDIATSQPVVTSSANDEYSSSVPPTTSSVNNDNNVASPSTSVPELLVQTQIIDMGTPVVEVADNVTTVSVTPAEVQKYIVEVAPEPVKSAEISFDGGDWTAISLSAPTNISIPKSAKSAVLQLTTKSGSKVQVVKTIQHAGETAVTTTEAPTKEPTTAPAVPGDESKSNNTAIFGGIGALLLLILVGAGVMQSRRKKSA